MTMQHDLGVAMQGDSAVCMALRFAAAPEPARRAVTAPDLVRRGLPCADLPVIRCDRDLRPGGAFDWCRAGRDGCDATYDRLAILQDGDVP